MNFLMFKKPSPPREWLLLMVFAETPAPCGLPSDVLLEKVLDHLADVVVVDVEDL